MLEERKSFSLPRPLLRVLSRCLSNSSLFCLLPAVWRDQSNLHCSNFFCPVQSTSCAIPVNRAVELRWVCHPQKVPGPTHSRHSTSNHPSDGQKRLRSTVVLGQPEMTSLVHRRVLLSLVMFVDDLEEHSGGSLAACLINRTSSTRMASSLVLSCPPGPVMTVRLRHVQRRQSTWISRQTDHLQASATGLFHPGSELHRQSRLFCLLLSPW